MTEAPEPITLTVTAAGDAVYIQWDIINYLALLPDQARQLAAELLTSADRTENDLAATRIEATLQHHLTAKHPDGWVLCACGETYEGPVYHRRHIASLIAAGTTCEPVCHHPSHQDDEGTR